MKIRLIDKKVASVGGRFFSNSFAGPWCAWQAGGTGRWTGQPITLRYISEMVVLKSTWHFIKFT